MKMFKHIALGFIIAAIWMWLCSPIAVSPNSETRHFVIWVMYPLLFCINWGAFFLMCHWRYW